MVESAESVSRRGDPVGVEDDVVPRLRRFREWPAPGSAFYSDVQEQTFERVLLQFPDSIPDLPMQPVLFDPAERATGQRRVVHDHDVLSRWVRLDDQSRNYYMATPGQLRTGLGYLGASLNSVRRENREQAVELARRKRELDEARQEVVRERERLERREQRWLERWEDYREYAAAVERRRQVTAGNYQLLAVQHDRQHALYDEEASDALVDVLVAGFEFNRLEADHLAARERGFHLPRSEAHDVARRRFSEAAQEVARLGAADREALLEQVLSPVDVSANLQKPPVIPPEPEPLSDDDIVEVSPPLNRRQAPEVSNPAGSKGKAREVNEFFEAPDDLALFDSDSEDDEDLDGSDGEAATTRRALAASRQQSRVDEARRERARREAVFGGGESSSRGVPTRPVSVPVAVASGSKRKREVDDEDDEEEVDASPSKAGGKGKGKARAKEGSRVEKGAKGGKKKK